MRQALTLLRHSILQNGILLLDRNEFVLDSLAQCQRLASSYNDCFTEGEKETSQEARALDELRRELDVWKNLYHSKFLYIDVQSIDNNDTESEENKSLQHLVNCCDKKIQSIVGPRGAVPAILLTDNKLLTSRFLEVGNLDDYERSQTEVTRKKWSQMFQITEKTHLKHYFQAFAACSEHTVRLYDPYLCCVLDSDDAKQTRWRISIKYLLQFFLKNESVHRIALVSEYERIKSILQWPLEDFRVDCLGHVPRNTPITIEFWFVRPKDSSCAFHDRFVANTQYAFAIGRGLDTLLNDAQLVSGINAYCCGSAFSEIKSEDVLMSGALTGYRRTEFQNISGRVNVSSQIGAVQVKVITDQDDYF
ncbi:hypothetical protein J6U76_00110 [bacterium]|nr:hypothetical protein [bacterium]